MPQTVMIADLHLSDDTPELNRLFLDSLEHWRGRVDALYLLGDVFEVWLGDDVLSGIAVQVACALKAFSAPVYFIRGNRDFLLGRRYAAQAGMILLPPQYPVELYGRRCLLTHGDEMCTDDRSYQRFRRIVRHPWIRRMLLALPQRRRRALAADIRAASRRKKRQMGQTPLADVTEAGIGTLLARYPQTEVLIHGHTHRPAIHGHVSRGRTIRRYVLPDWYGGRGGCLIVSPEGIRLSALPAETPLPPWHGAD